MNKILVLLVCLGLSGCTSVQQIRMEDYASPPKINQEGSVYIAIPADGQYGVRTYSGSGTLIAHLLKSAFSTHIKRVETSVGVEEFKVGAEKAKSQSLTYFVYPTILHWEDSNTDSDLLGKSDEVEVKIIIVDIDSGNTIDSVIIKGKSKFIFLGGSAPEGLLPELIEDYVSSLF